MSLSPPEAKSGNDFSHLSVTATATASISTTSKIPPRKPFQDLTNTNNNSNSKITNKVNANVKGVEDNHKQPKAHPVSVLVETPDFVGYKIKCGSCETICFSASVWKSHLLSSRHSIEVEGTLGNWTEEENERSVVILNSQPFTLKEKMDIFDTYASVGIIKDCCFLYDQNGAYCVLQFMFKWVAEVVTKNKCELNGFSLPTILKPECIIRFPNWKPRVATITDIPGCDKNAADMKNNGFQFSSKHGSLLSVLNDEAMTLDCQLKVFITRTTLTPKDIKMREKVIQDLYSQIKMRFDRLDFYLYVFGSTYTRLGDSNSDLDVFMDLHTSTRNITKRLTREQTIYERLFQFLSFNPGQFSSIVSIPNARVPVIKLIHNGTGVHVDLVINGLMARKNSELLEFYIQMDPCVSPLIILIRYWANFHELAGFRKFKSYAISLLVIFYLQRENIIPSVKSLQDMLTPEEWQPRIDGFWNAALPQIHNDGRNKENPEEIAEPALPALKILKLAQGFFEMYTNLDYEKQIICSFTGEFLYKSMFRNFHKERNWNGLPKELCLYKKWALGSQGQNYNRQLEYYKCICLQDPFELSKNVLVDVNPQVLQKFVDACGTTAERISMIRCRNNAPEPRIMDIFVDMDMENRSTISDPDIDDEYSLLLKLKSEKL